VDEEGKSNRKAETLTLSGFLISQVKLRNALSPNNKRRECNDLLEGTSKVSGVTSRDKVGGHSSGEESKLEAGKKKRISGGKGFSFILWSGSGACFG